VLVLEAAWREMADEPVVASEDGFISNEPCQNEIQLVVEEQTCPPTKAVGSGTTSEDASGVSLQIGGNEEQDKSIMFKVVDFAGLSEGKGLGIHLQSFQFAQVSDDKPSSSSVRVADIGKNSVAFVDGRLKVGDCISKINDTSLTGLSTEEAR
jgi:hypothetical protein